MNSTTLITFLDCPDGPQQFKRAAAEPLAIFRRNVTTKGYSSAPVEITAQKTTIPIKAKHVRRLCEWYLAGEIDGVEIDYVGGFKFQVQRVNDDAVAHRPPGAWRS